MKNKSSHFIFRGIYVKDDGETQKNTNTKKTEIQPKNPTGSRLWASDGEGLCGVGGAEPAGSQKHVLKIVVKLVLPEKTS